MFSLRPKKFKRSKREDHSARPSQPDVDYSASKVDNNITPRVERHGLFVLYPGNASSHLSADIIALHGLGGDAYETWTDKKGHLWLRDSLPGHVPDTRIMTFGYDSATWSGSKSTILEFAVDLLERLRIARKSKQEKERQIIFICHSLGGLVCKSALVVAHERPEYNLLLRNVQGIIFMGTPHRGSKLAGIAKPLSNIVNLAILRKRLRSDLLSNLEISSTTVTEITLSAVHRLAPLEIVSFYEQKVLEPLGCWIVEPFSAILGLPNEKVLPLSADHRNMVRLSPAEQEKYRPVWTAIAEMVGNCHGNPEGASDWDEVRNLLDTLYYVDCGSFPLETPAAHNGTCVWILENEVFVNWLTSNSSGAFWLHGHPGRGKTVLARFLIETLKAMPENHTRLHKLPPFKVVHYMLLEQDKERGSIEAILRSLLHQLILEDPSTSPIVRHYFSEERRILEPEKHPETLWKAFRGVLELNQSTNIAIFIDGLDELDYPTLAGLLNGLSSIQRVIQERQPEHKLKFVFTSRPNDSVSHLLLKFDLTKLEISSRKGVELFVTTEVTEYGERHFFPQDLSQQIIHELVQKADGMFLWASLAWNDFKTGVTIWSSKTIQDQLVNLKTLPKGLENLYSSLLAKMDPVTLRDLRPLFQCLIAAQAPLSCEEMAVALAVTDCKSHADMDTAFSITHTIEISCPNFVKVDDNGTIRFLHQSIKYFLIDSTEHMDLTSAHSSVARICINYLSFEDLPIPADPCYERYSKDARKRFALLGYSESWLRIHMEFIGHEDKMWASFCRLLIQDKCLPGEGRERAAPLLLAMRKGSIRLFLTFLEAGCDIDAKLYGSPPLHWAIQMGKIDMALVLLDRGANVNSRDDSKRTALHFAIRDRQGILVERLMMYKDININLQDVDGRTPLHWAVMARADDLLRLLQDSRIDTGATDNDRRTALTYAAYWGAEQAVKILLQNTTTLEQHQENDMSPIICAAQQGWKELTLSLLPRVANINLHRGIDRKGLLHWAAIYDWGEVIQAAIEQAAAKPNQIDTSGRTPLHYAAVLGNHSAAKQLVRCGASAQISDNAGRSAVQLAAIEGFADVLNLLLQESQYNVNERDAQGCSLLHWAASHDWVPIIQIVIEHPEVDLSRRDNYGRTALHIAAVCGCPNVLRVLLDLNFYDINQVDAVGNTLLHLAARIGNANVCREVLKDSLCDKNRRNKFGQTALDVSRVYTHSTWEHIFVLEEAGVRYSSSYRQTLQHSSVSDVPFEAADPTYSYEEWVSPYADKDVWALTIGTMASRLPKHRDE